MPFDFKKVQKNLYVPSVAPAIISVPTMNYAAVRGCGDPNEENGAYQKAIQVLYAVSYTLKMSYKGPHRIEGFYEYVVPPLEGLWWQEDTPKMDLSRKAGMHWTALIRLPDFIQEADFLWAVAEAEKKKRLDCSAAEFLTLNEGLCVQALHIGPFDSEQSTIDAMEAFLQERGLVTDLSSTRRHHEIYLSNPRKTVPAMWKTVIRHPVRQAQAEESRQNPHPLGTRSP